MSFRKHYSDQTTPNFLICYNDGGMANCSLQAGCDSYNILDQPMETDNVSVQYLC